MANVIVKVTGGEPFNETVGTIGELKRKLGYQTHTAAVNGRPADDNYNLKDDEYVSLAPAVKGGK